MEAPSIPRSALALPAPADALAPANRAVRAVEADPEALRRTLVAALGAEGPRIPPPRHVDVKFQVDTQLDRVIAKIVDSETGEVVREVPPEDLVELARRVTALVGAMFDRRV
jgi:hypothetical protein